MYFIQQIHYDLLGHDDCVILFYLDPSLRMVKILSKPD